MSCTFIGLHQTDATPEPPHINNWTKMLHTEPPYSNYGTKIFGVQTGRIETRHLFSVDGQRAVAKLVKIKNDPTSP